MLYLHLNMNQGIYLHVISQSLKGEHVFQFLKVFPSPSPSFLHLRYLDTCSSASYFRLPYAHLSIYLFIYLCIYLTFYLFIYLSAPWEVYWHTYPNIKRKLRKLKVRSREHPILDRQTDTPTDRRTHRLTDGNTDRQPCTLRPFFYSVQARLVYPVCA